MDGELSVKLEVLMTERSIVEVHVAAMEAVNSAWQVQGYDLVYTAIDFTVSERKLKKIAAKMEALIDPDEQGKSKDATEVGYVDPSLIICKHPADLGPLGNWLKLLPYIIIGAAAVVGILLKIQ